MDINKLSTTAKVVFIAVAALSVISNISTSGLVIGTAKGLVGTVLFILMFGYPTAWVIRRFKKTERYIWSDVIVYGAIWCIIMTIIIMLFVLSNLR